MGPFSKEKMEVKSFCKNTDVKPSIKPREAVFSGRNAAKLYHLCYCNEKINIMM